MAIINWIKTIVEDIKTIKEKRLKTIGFQSFLVGVKGFEPPTSCSQIW